MTPFSSSLKKDISMGILWILTNTMGMGTFKLEIDLNSFEAVLLLSVISSGLLVLILMSLEESRSSSPKTSMIYIMLNANFLVIFYIAISDRVSVQNARSFTQKTSNLVPVLRISKKSHFVIIHYPQIDINFEYIAC